MSPTDPSPSCARDRALIKVQAASGALFALFLLAHLVNQMFAVAGPDAYNQLQGQLRAVYQAPLLELVLVAVPLLVHVTVSVWRMARRRRLGQPPPRARRAAWQRRTAIVLLVFALGHILATRGASLFYDVFPDFDAIAYTMVWQFGYFFPYYLLFSIAALYHLLNGLSLALPRIGLVGPPAARSHRVAAAAWLAGALALTLGVAGFAGAWQAVRDRAIASSYAELLTELGLAEPPASQP